MGLFFCLCQPANVLEGDLLCVDVAFGSSVGVVLWQVVARVDLTLLVPQRAENTRSLERFLEQSQALPCESLRENEEIPWEGSTAKKWFFQGL